MPFGSGLIVRCQGSRTDTKIMVRPEIGRGIVRQHLDFIATGPVVKQAGVPSEFATLAPTPDYRRKSIVCGGPSKPGRLANVS